MSQLHIYHDADASKIKWQSRNVSEISIQLGALGVRFEQWEANEKFGQDADDATVVAAYSRDIDRLKNEKGYRSVDVVRLLPDNPKAAELRQKFLEEHIHAEDEVRFFVEGAGMFYLHIDDQVCVLLCERGDLVSVPGGIPHWFDTGAKPHFTAIRLFTNPDGWVAKYTGLPIASRFPKYDVMPTSPWAA